MRGAKYLHHVTLVLWAVTLAFFVLVFIGRTTLFSSFFREENIKMAVEITFFVLVAAFALLLARLLAPPKRIIMKIVTFLMPFIIFIIFFVFSASFL